VSTADAVTSVCRRAQRAVEKAFVVRRAGTRVGADLGGSSKRSGENLEDRSAGKGSAPTRFEHGLVGPKPTGETLLCKAGQGWREPSRVRAWRKGSRQKFLHLTSAGLGAILEAILATVSRRLGRVFFSSYQAGSPRSGVIACRGVRPG